MGGLSARGGGKQSWPAGGPGGGGGGGGGSDWTRTEYTIATGLTTPVTPQTPAATLWSVNNQILFKAPVDVSGAATIEIDESIENGRWVVGVLSESGFISITFAQGDFETEPTIVRNGKLYWLVLDEDQGLSIVPIEQIVHTESFSEDDIWYRKVSKSLIFVDTTAAAFSLNFDTNQLSDGDEVTVVDAVGSCGTNPLTILPMLVQTYSVSYTAAELAATVSPSFEFAIPALNGKHVVSIEMSGTPYTGSAGLIEAGIRTNGGAFYFPLAPVSAGDWDGTAVVVDVNDVIALPTARFSQDGGGDLDPAAGSVSFEFTYLEATDAGTINGRTSHLINEDYGYVRLAWSGDTGSWTIVSSPQTNIVISAPAGVTVLSRHARQYVRGNSTGGAATVALPGDPFDGDVVVFKDSEGTAASNGYTIDGNGKSIDADTSIEVTTPYLSYTLVYDGTRWGLT